MEPGYLIGAGLLGRINETIERVAGQPYGGQTTSVTPRLEGGQPGSSKNFRVCTFTGAWSVGSTKTVTFRGVTATPNTVSVTNLFVPITKTATTGSCAIAKEGTAWYLISGLPGVARGTFTAPWAKGATASVADAVDVGTTYTAKNYFAAITGSGARACAIAYAGGEWILIAAEC
jgi:hypothetical protein